MEEVWERGGATRRGGGEAGATGSGGGGRDDSQAPAIVPAVPLECVPAHVRCPLCLALLSNPVRAPLCAPFPLSMAARAAWHAGLPGVRPLCVLEVRGRCAGSRSLPRRRRGRPRDESRLGWGEHEQRARCGVEGGEMSMRVYVFVFFLALYARCRCVREMERWLVCGHRQHARPHLLPRSLAAWDLLRRCADKLSRMREAYREPAGKRRGRRRGSG